MQFTEKDYARFWAKVDRRGPDECWEWRGSRMAGGYGLWDLRRGGERKAQRAHRVAYELSVGEIGEGLMLRHRCDNPPCCNPAHLEPGTAKDNTADMISRGRHWTQQHPEMVPRGEDHWTRRKGTESVLKGVNHPGAKLTPEKVQEIRLMVASGKKQRAVAREFGVSQGTVWQIVKGNYWKET